MTQNILRKLMLISVLLIGSHAFAYDFEATNSDGVTIYYNITSVSDFTCEVTSDGVSYSDSVEIPQSVVFKNRTWKVTSIGGDAFHDCVDLISVIIPNSVTSINSYAFTNCKGLSQISIPNSVTNIGYASFSGCTGLNSLIIPNSVLSIDGNAFSYCTGLASITIPNSISRISNATFFGCNGLTSIIIPNSVYSISSQAFEGCTSLTSVTIGNCVEIIEDRAFSGCTSLSVINSLRKDFYHEIGYTFSKFDAITYMEATLRIPKGSLASYQATDGWKEFWNIVEVENLEDVLNGAVTTYNVNANYDSAQGSVSINGTAGTYATVNVDSEIAFVVTPNAGYTIDKVTLNGTDVTADVVDNKYTVAKATEDITFAVTFKKQTFALELKCSEAGSFERIINYGEIATYKIVPSENWEINTVTFNGTDVTIELVDNVFTTPEITEDSELSVVFVDIASSVFSVYNTSDVKVYASQQTINIKGLEDNTPVAVYDPNGQMEYSKVATDYEMNINMNKDGVYLVKVGEKTFKVML